MSFRDHVEREKKIQAKCDNNCPYMHDREQLIQLNQKVDMLLSELVEGNTKVGRVGHMKKTNDRLRVIEEKIEEFSYSRLSPENVKVVNKMIDLFGSYRFLFGMLITSLLAAFGMIRFGIEIAKFFRG